MSNLILLVKIEMTMLDSFHQLIKTMEINLHILFGLTKKIMIIQEKHFFIEVLLHNLVL